MTGLENAVFLSVVAIVLIPLWASLYPEGMTIVDRFQVWLVNFVGLTSIFYLVFGAVPGYIVGYSWLVLLGAAIFTRFRQLFQSSSS